MRANGVRENALCDLWFSSEKRVSPGAISADEINRVIQSAGVDAPRRSEEIAAISDAISIGELLVLADTTPPDTAMGDMVCDLTVVQKATVRSVLAERNESCSYNMTVASVLAD